MTETELAEGERLLVNRERLRAIVKTGNFPQYPGLPGWREHYACGEAEKQFNRWLAVHAPALLFCAQSVMKSNSIPKV